MKDVWIVENKLEKYTKYWWFNFIENYITFLLLSRLMNDYKLSIYNMEKLYRASESPVSEINLY